MLDSETRRSRQPLTSPSSCFRRRVPIGALCIAAEMLLFTGVHLFSGDSNYGQVIYWLVVAAICAFIAYGRFVLKRL